MQSVTYKGSRTKYLSVCILIFIFVLKMIFSIIEKGIDQSIFQIIIVVFFLAFSGPFILKFIQLAINNADMLTLDDHGYHLKAWYPRIAWKHVNAVFLMQTKYHVSLCFEVEPEIMKNVKIKGFHNLFSKLKIGKDYGDISINTALYTSTHTELLETAVRFYEQAVPDLEDYKEGKRKRKSASL